MPVKLEPAAAEAAGPAAPGPAKGDPAAARIAGPHGRPDGPDAAAAAATAAGVGVQRPGPLEPPQPGSGSGAGAAGQQSKSWVQHPNDPACWFYRLPECWWTGFMHIGLATKIPGTAPSAK